jgi:hypothetical protein
LIFFCVDTHECPEKSVRAVFSSDKRRENYF